MLEKSGLIKRLGIGLIATTMGMHPSLSYKNICNFFHMPVQQEVIEEKIPARISGEELQKAIMQENLNTGKFSSEQVVEIIEKSIQNVGGLPEYMDEGVIYSFVDNESSWNPKAKSKKGAKGLGQIMENTWKTHNPKVSYAKAYEPATNLETAIKVLNGNEKYFERMHPRWGNLSKEEKLKIHAAAYNCGPGKLEKAGWSLEKKRGGIPLETRMHVTKVLETYESLLRQEI